MKHIVTKAALFLILLALACRTASAVDNTDVIVIAGQSNAVGYGIGPGVDPVSDPRVLQWEFDGTVALATNPLSGPQSEAGRFGSGLHLGIGYANKYLAASRKVLLVPTAASEVNGAVEASGNVNVFTIASDQSLRTARVIKGVAPAWTNLGGTVAGTYVWPVVEDDGDLTVVTLGANLALNGRTRANATGSWGKWTKVGAGGVLARAPTVVQDPEGNLVVFGLNKAGAFSSVSCVGETWGTWTKSD